MISSHSENQVMPPDSVISGMHRQLFKPYWFWIGAVGIGLLTVAVYQKDALGIGLTVLNGALMLTFIQDCIKSRSLPAVLPMAFILILFLGVSIAPLAFYLFAPEATISLRHGLTHLPYLFRNARYQMAVLTFIAPYLLIVWPLVRKDRREFVMPSVRVARGFGWFIPLMFLSISVLTVMSHLFSTAAARVMITVYGYFLAIAMILGVTYRQSNVVLRWLMYAAFAINGLFYTLWSQRRNALMPVAFFVLGLWCFAGLKKLTRVIILLVGGFGLVAFLTVGAVLRSETNLGVGSQQNLAERILVMKNIDRYFDVDYEEAFMGVMARFFFAGGHSVVTRSPGEIPYQGMDAGQYSKEFALNFVPGFLIKSIAASERAEYSGNWHLRKFGFMLTDEHQVGITAFGSYWAMGGWVWAAIGGGVTALLHLLLMLLVGRYQKQSTTKGLWFTSMLLVQFLWYSGRNELSSIRFLFWSFVVAWVSYHVLIKHLIGEDLVDEAVEFERFPTGTVEAY
ncbi:MAG: hypothetical protein ACLFUJ_01375 [Phycisphaerae bacterium]